MDSPFFSVFYDLQTTIAEEERSNKQNSEINLNILYQISVITAQNIE